MSFVLANGADPATAFDGSAWAAGAQDRFVSPQATPLNAAQCLSRLLSSRRPTSNVKSLKSFLARTRHGIKINCGKAIFTYIVKAELI
jgi:hypothetical protein